jgi:hypothetical protein
VRAKDGVVQQLAAEENLRKEVEIMGLLNNPRTLDILHTVRGEARPRSEPISPDSG